MKFAPGQELYPWYKIFTALSLAQFEIFWRKLDFPFYPTESLRQISYDFSFKYVISTNLHATEQTNNVIDFLKTLEIEPALKEEIDQISTRTSFKLHLQQLFDKAFIELENHGYSDKVYEWGITSYTYSKINRRQNYENSEYLERWTILLRKWAITAWITQGRSIPLEWQAFFDFFIDIYQSSKTSIEGNNRPIISDKVLENVQTIVLTHELDKYEIEATQKNAFRSPRNTWEAFASSNIELWLELELRYRINRSIWEQIMNLLSPQEKHALQSWGAKMGVMDWPSIVTS